MSLEPTENQKNAQFHWGEGNKFAIEFCKSLFLFNSTLAGSLIVYIATTHESENINTLSHISNAVFWLLAAAVLTLVIFAMGYFINLQHGNYHISSNSNRNKIWDFANVIQIILYLFVFCIFLFIMTQAFFNLFVAFKITIEVPNYIIFDINHYLQTFA